MDSPASILDQAVALAVFCFIGAIVVVSIGGYLRRPQELGEIHGSAILGRRIRGWYYANLVPFEEFCIRWRVAPAHLSYAQLLTGMLVAACYAAGLLTTAGWLLLFAGTLDIIDGRVARRTDGGSARGAFLDSVIDRYTDSFAYLGLAVFFRNSWVLWAVLIALIGGLIVSYTRARGEGLGAQCRVGLLQRPERYVILGFGTIFGSLLDHLIAPWVGGPRHWLLILTIALLAALVNFTAIQRAVHIWRALGEDPRV